jgi:uncharacterized membrane protein
MTLESSRTLGGIGAILILIGTLPILGFYSYGILALVGLILVLVALNRFSNIYKDKGIFNNSLYGLIAGIVGIIIASIVLFVSVLSTLKTFLEKIYPTWNGSWSTISSLSGMTPNTSNLALGDIGPFIAGIFAVFVVLWIFLIIWAFFARRSLNTLSTKTHVGLFSTASLLLIIGAALTIIIIGLLLMWVAILLLAFAFFQIRPQPQPEQPTTPGAPPITPMTI